MPSPRHLDPGLASQYAELALAGVVRQWPHAYQHLANGPREIRLPRRLHPAFYGCYDWHSSVHSHWTLARIRMLHPDLPASRRVVAVLDRHLSPAKMQTEAAYFRGRGRASFERPYGWGWLLALAQELRAGRDPHSRRWARAMRPLEGLIADSFRAWLPRLKSPLRTGAHNNTAFGLALALDYSRAAGDRPLARLISSRARDFFLADCDAPGAWEPGGEDFLSPTLTEADLMRRVLPPDRFSAWWRRFLPRIPPNLKTPADPGPSPDGKTIHLDGLNLSRAWAFRGIASSLTGARRAEVLALSDVHAQSGLARVASGDYLGEHWLASFALYLLTSETAQRTS